MSIASTSASPRPPNPCVACCRRTASVRPASRSSRVSPRQKTGVRPLSSAWRSLRASSSSGSPKIFRRSEWPIRTCVAPASRIMRAAISPVKAPSFPGWRFWAPTSSLVPRQREAASARAVAGGKIRRRVPSRRSPAPSRIPSIRETASPRVLYIFQLPATQRSWRPALIDRPAATAPPRPGGPSPRGTRGRRRRRWRCG